MKHIKSLAMFLSEGLDVVRDKKAKHVEDIETKDGSNKKAEEEAQDYIDDKKDYCPRCGEHIEDCKCETEDPWSTQNYHRVPKGKEEKSKAKQEFKNK